MIESIDKFISRFSRYILAIYTVVTIAFFIYFPISILYVYSVNDVPYFVPEWRGFTLKWFIKIFERKDLIMSLQNSLVIAVFVTAVSMALGIPPSFYIVRGRGRIKNIYLLYLMIPFIVPWIIIGVGDYIFFWFLHIEKSLITAALAHIIYSIPLVVTILAPRLYSLDPSLEEASMDLGADEFTTFRKIILPLVFPSIASSAIITFAWSFDNFIISYFTLGNELTWPVWVFSVIGKIPRIMPVINAVSVIIITLSSIGIYLLARKGLTELF